MKCKHADLIKLYAEDCLNYEKPWELWEYKYTAGEWERLLCHPKWYGNNEYRRRSENWCYVYENEQGEATLSGLMPSFKVANGDANLKADQGIRILYRPFKIRDIKKKEFKPDITIQAKHMLEWHPETFGLMTWEEAMEKCKSLGDGWRLPTIEELSSVVDYSKYDPATLIEGFKSSNYWSSSAHVYSTVYAWLVDFCSGCVSSYFKSDSYYVRAVRSIGV